MSSSDGVKPRAKAQGGKITAAPLADFQHTDEGHPKRWWILGFLCLSLVLIVASVSSINVALPSIQRELNATNSDLQWIVDSYALMFAGFLLPLGSLGDHFGRRKVLILGLIIFGVATCIASAATEAIQVILMRGIMGVGAALIMPATLSIVTEVFSSREQPKAIAVWSGFAGAGAVIGPIGAGLTLKWFWWGGVFLVTVPIVVVGLLGAIFVVPKTERHTHSFPFDPLGGLLSILAIGTVIYALIEGPNYGWTDSRVLGTFVIAALTTILFILWERATQHPMLDPAYFKNQRFTISSLVITVVFFGLFGWLFLLTQYFQFAQGHTALDAGLRLLPSAIVMLLVAPRSAGLAAIIGARRIISSGMFLVGFGLGLLSFVDSSTPYWVVVICLVICSSGLALLMPTATQHIVSSLPSSEAGVGSAVNDTTREVGGSIGIAVVGSLLTVGYRRGVGNTVDEVVDEVSAAGLPEEAIVLAEGARDSIGRALFAATELGSRGLSEEFVQRLRTVAIDGFNDGMTLGLVVISAIILMTGVIVAFSYPLEELALEAGSERMDGVVADGAVVDGVALLDGAVADGVSLDGAVADNAAERTIPESPAKS